MRPISIIAGQKYTIYTITGTTIPERNEVIIMTVLPSPQHCESDGTSHHLRHRIGAYQLAGSQELFDLDIDIRATIIIPGWDPLSLCDPYEYEISTGTAQFASSLVAIRRMLATNVNPHFDQYELLLASVEPKLNFFITRI